jgi:hypothetical protein
MNKIELSLLVENEETVNNQGEKTKPKTNKSIKDITFKGRLSSGRMTNDIKSTNSRANKEPENLLKDLGINLKNIKGESNEQKLIYALELSMENNKLMGIAFKKPIVLKDDDVELFLIETTLDITKYPSVYIGALALALQKLNILSNDFEPNPSGVLRGKRNIALDNWGRTVVAPMNWIEKRYNS